MTNEDYKHWLMGMVEHNRRMSKKAEGALKIEYWTMANAYQKALDVFLEDVMGEEA